MATQNPRELVAELLEALRGGLAPFVARELERAEKKGKRNQIRWLQDDPNLRGKKVEEWDAAGLLKVVADGWNDLFNQTLGQEHRELRLRAAELAQQVGASGGAHPRRRVQRGGLRGAPPESGISTERRRRRGAAVEDPRAAVVGAEAEAPEGGRRARPALRVRGEGAAAVAARGPAPRGRPLRQLPPGRVRG
jgi:hypothetical protein